MTRKFVWLFLGAAVLLAATSSVAIGTSVATDTNSSLLTESQLFEDVVDGNPENHTATLYYVAANGTWYHAETDGTIDSRAPYGDVVPNVDVEDGNRTTNETVNIDEQRLPAYVWKVTREGCGTTVYDAETGGELTGIHVPSCTQLQRPNPPGATAGPGTPSAEPTPDEGSPANGVATSTVADPAETTTESGPGFGVTLAIVAVGLSVFALGRR